MAITTCKECGGQVSDKAEKCPHCGAPIKKPLMHRKVGCFSVLIVCVLFLAIMSVAEDYTKRRNAEIDREKFAQLTDEQKLKQLNDKADRERLDGAPYACSEFMKKQAHDPSSAEFPQLGRSWKELRKDGTVRVQVEMRARNGFNAVRTNTYDCVVRLTADRWHLVSLKMLNR